MGRDQQFHWNQGQLEDVARSLVARWEEKVQELLPEKEEQHMIHEYIGRCPEDWMKATPRQYLGLSSEDIESTKGKLQKERKL